MPTWRSASLVVDLDLTRHVVHDKWVRHRVVDRCIIQQRAHVVSHERDVRPHAVVGECRPDELQFVVEVERQVVVHRIHLAAKNIVRVSTIDERQRCDVCLQRNDDVVVAD